NPPCLCKARLLYASAYPNQPRTLFRAGKTMNNGKSLFALLLTFVGLIAVASQSARGQNWPQWRGPSFNGSTADTGFPATFSKTENVKWVANLPGPSAATPVIWNERVFVSTVDQQAGTLQAVCLDRANGKVLWQHETGAGIRI